MPETELSLRELGRFLAMQDGLVRGLAVLTVSSCQEAAEETSQQNIQTRKAVLDLPQDGPEDIICASEVRNICIMKFNSSKHAVGIRCE